MVSSANSIVFDLTTDDKSFMPIRKEEDYNTLFGEITINLYELTIFGFLV